MIDVDKIHEATNTLEHKANAKFCKEEDIKEKIKEYINGLEKQIKAGEKWLVEHPEATMSQEFITVGGTATLKKVKDDLQNILRF